MCAIEKTMNCVAFDCGNSSFRTVVGQYNGEKITMDVISQVPNGAIEVNGLYYWDILYIFEGLKKGLKEAFNKYGHIDSIGICTWGVDFGLLDKNGYLLSNPLSYRNTIGEQELSNLSIDQKRNMFDWSGIQCNRINSIYPLSGIRRLMPELTGAAKHLLMIPDLLVYMFTGKMFSEFSIASTTQLVDVRSGAYSDEILNMFQLDKAMFKPQKQHGEMVGILKDSIVNELGIDACPVICVPSHDTACAVTAVPTLEEDFLFISSGTWSLVGTELEKPIINQAVFERDFANEGGVFNTITMLKNSAGMHILQCIKRDLEADGKKYSWDDIVQLAKSFTGAINLFDPNSYELFNPTNMMKAIQVLMGSDDLSEGQVLASAYHSLAYSYKYAVEQIQQITGINYSSIYIVGGGSRNDYLNQLTADITGKTVFAGPNEATSLGNVGVQLKYHHQNLNLSTIREIIKKSEQIQLFEPDTRRNLQEIEDRYQFFLSQLS